MKNILSIQSHVVFGHAGNSAAEFPMRRMGGECLAAEYRSVFESYSIWSLDRLCHAR